jgi:hypothetical protein
MIRQFIPSKVRGAIVQPLYFSKEKTVKVSRIVISSVVVAAILSVGPIASANEAEQAQAKCKAEAAKQGIKNEYEVADYVEQCMTSFEAGARGVAPKGSEGGGGE